MEDGHRLVHSAAAELHQSVVRPVIQKSLERERSACITGQKQVAYDERVR
jgi:hypothetical protein